MANIHPAAASEISKYIAEMPSFSKVICEKLRKIILNTDKKIIEDWKWGPNYYYEGMICGYGGFKQHAKLTFFNGSAMKDKYGLFNHCVDNEFSRSIKYTDVGEINEKQLQEYIRESMALNQAGFKRAVKNKQVDVPEDLNKELAKNKKAKIFFNELTYGYKKEYVEWLTEAKREETRQKRLEKIVEYCSDQKRLNEKYY